MKDTSLKFLPCQFIVDRNLFVIRSKHYISANINRLDRCRSFSQSIHIFPRLHAIHTPFDWIDWNDARL